MICNTSNDAQIEKACRMTAKAMINTACFVEIFRGTEESRLSSLSFLFKKNYLMMQNKCPEAMHYTFADNGDLDCFFMLVPNDVAHFSLCEMINGGLLELPLYYGYFSMQRLLQVSEFAQATEKELMAEYPHYLAVQRMVVTPTKQGQGIGTKCLNKALVEVADKQQLPVILGTHEARNVTFYSRL